MSWKAPESDLAALSGPRRAEAPRGSRRSRRRHRAGATVGAAFALCLSASPGAAQCEPEWLPGDPLPGVIGGVGPMTLWDPDGPGPEASRVVVGGQIRTAGSIMDPGNLVAWDPATGSWSPLGGGIGPWWSGFVLALAVLPNGDLVAGGRFDTAGGVAARSIARFDGAEWQPLDGELSGGTYGPAVTSLAQLASGDLIVAGSFLTAGGVAVNHIARWDGAEWHALGAGMDGPVSVVKVLPGGDIVAGGAFTTAGGVTVNHIARWDGSAWRPLGSGLTGCIPTHGGCGTRVHAMAVLPGGDLIVGGDFLAAGGKAVSCIARWDGSQWHPLGGGTDWWVIGMLALPNGDLIVSGEFQTVGGLEVNRVARWDGDMWHPLGSGVDSAIGSLLMLPDGDLLAGGAFTEAGGLLVMSLARWDGRAWNPISRELNSYVFELLTAPDGDVIAGGQFTTIGGIDANRIARFDGSAWHALGSGMDGPYYPSIYALARLPGGDVIAGGRFTSAGGVPANNIARWDGSAWNPMDAGTDGGVGSLAVLPSGDVIAGGRFTTASGVTVNGVARWDGSAWSALGGGVGPGAFKAVGALTTLPNGDLVAGGDFTTAGGVPLNHIALWDGAEWRPPGGGLSGPVSALATLPSGAVVASGAFREAGDVEALRIAIWDGSEWGPLGEGIGSAEPGSSDSVSELLALPNGDLLVGGRFEATSGAASSNIRRWDGREWRPVGSGVGSGTPGVHARVGALAGRPAGEIMAAGLFMTAGERFSPRLARWACICYADCDGSGEADFLDFLCFQNAFAAETPYADCDGGGEFDVFDFLCFQNAFAAGCP